MDNNEEKQPVGEIIDVEPDVESASTAASDAADKSQGSPARSQLPLILAIIAIVAVTASWIAGYRYWQKIADDLVTIEERISSTSEQQQTLTTEIQNAKNILQQHKQEIEQQAETSTQQTAQLVREKQEITRQAEVMQQTVDQINEKVSRSSNQWQLAEARYLMRIANQKLALSRDISTALAALVQADQTLRDSADLGLIAVREKLAAEISQLKAIVQPDITGIASQLQGLSLQVNQLKLAGVGVDRSSVAEDSATKPAERNLDTLLADSWQGFRKPVVIRQHDKPVSAMLPPSQQFFLYQNLQLQLQSARLSLLRQETILFKNSLETASEWLTSFFDQEDNKTQSMLATLNSLSQTELEPSLPSIAGSLNLLNQHLETAQ